MMNLIIQKNICQAIEFFRKNKTNISQSYFLMADNSALKREQQELADITFLKMKIPNLRQISLKELKNFSSDQQVFFFGWDSFDERMAIKDINALLGSQNRLLDDFPMKKLKSFTPFRYIAEKMLPERFTENIHQVDDKEVKRELQYYFEETHLAKEYFEIRNGVVGRDYSTKFSNHLASGRLNVRFLYNYLKEYECKYGENKSTYWIQFELLWREFFYWSYQKHQNSYFSLNGLKGKKDFYNYGKLTQTHINTDELFIDDLFMLATCRELLQTGFISNRVRQIFASTWIHKYELDWRLGAIFFERHLIDYDVYSNWGNWQYLAGVGHDPRGKRKFDVIRQMNNYDPGFSYIKKWMNINRNELIEINLKKHHS
jgi:deoxyribodipyrimidine photolyase